MKDIIAHTARHDEYTAAAPIRWGEGKIDAAAGVAYLQTAAGIEDFAEHGRKDKGMPGWYTIDGRPLSGRPTAAGLYIVGQRKMVIR